VNKEQIKKLFLGGLGLIALLYVYFSFFLGPLNKSRDAVQAKIKICRPKSRRPKPRYPRRQNWRRPLTPRLFATMRCVRLVLRARRSRGFHLG
jgi:hypothetical protein